MSETESFFADGEAYELTMGRWSRVAGQVFLDWLSLPNGLRWIDIGCGTGAFTELVLNRSAPSAISGVDPSEDQIAYAKSRAAASNIDYRLGDALSLPFGDDEFDVAVMALVIGQLSDRAKAMAEMKRVVRPGGTVATYVWDGPDKGHPQQPLFDTMKALSGELKRGPGNQARPIGVLRELFDASGLEDVTSHTIDIQLTFKGFDQFWVAQTALASRTVQAIRNLSESDVQRFKALLLERLPTDTDGRIAYMAQANALKGRVSG
jgi:ubiquinone/menaquinone biosynthesis C-methylase UbiE